MNIEQGIIATLGTVCSLDNVTCFITSTLAFAFSGKKITLDVFGMNKHLIE